MVRVASEDGAESATVARVIALAGVSSGTFYALFEDRQDCLTAVFEEAVAIATKHVSAAYDTEATWVDRVRAAVLALLELLDEERELARLCVGHAVASPRCSCAAGQVLDELTRIIDQGRSASRAARNPPPLAAQGVLGGALGLLYARLSARDPAFAGGAPEPVDVAGSFSPTLALRQHARSNTARCRRVAPRVGEETASAGPGRRHGSTAD